MRRPCARRWCRSTTSRALAPRSRSTRRRAGSLRRRIMRRASSRPCPSTCSASASRRCEYRCSRAPAAPSAPRSPSTGPRPTVLQEVRSSRLTPCPHDRATTSGALRERDRLPAGARRAPLGAGRRGQDEAGGRPGGVRRARPRHRGRGQDVHQVMSAPDCASRSACFLRRTSCYKGRASVCVRANTL